MYTKPGFWPSGDGLYILSLCNEKMQDLVYYVGKSQDCQKRLNEGHFRTGAKPGCVQYLLKMPSLGLDARYHKLKQVIVDQSTIHRETCGHMESKLTIELGKYIGHPARVYGGAWADTRKKKLAEKWLYMAQEEDLCNHCGQPMSKKGRHNCASTAALKTTAIEIHNPPLNGFDISCFPASCPFVVALVDIQTQEPPSNPLFGTVAAPASSSNTQNIDTAANMNIGDTQTAADSPSAETPCDDIMKDEEAKATCGSKDSETDKKNQPAKKLLCGSTSWLLRLQQRIQQLPVYGGRAKTLWRQLSTRDRERMCTLVERIPKGIFKEYRSTIRELRNGRARRSQRPFTIQERKRKSVRMQYLRTLAASLKKVSALPNKERISSLLAGEPDSTA